MQTKKFEKKGQIKVFLVEICWLCDENMMIAIKGVSLFFLDSKLKKKVGQIFFGSFEEKVRARNL